MVVTDTRPWGCWVDDGQRVQNLRHEEEDFVLFLTPIKKGSEYN